MCELLEVRVRSRVDEKIDVVLPKQRDVLAPVSGHRREPHHLEQAMQLRDAVRARRGELDELEAVGRQRVVLDEIGGASCRERVCQYVWIWVVAVALKKKRRR